MLVTLVSTVGTDGVVVTLEPTVGKEGGLKLVRSETLVLIAVVAPAPGGSATRPASAGGVVRLLVLAPSVVRPSAFVSELSEGSPGTATAIGERMLVAPALVAVEVA